MPITPELAQATGRLAGLHSHGKTPDPAVKRAVQQDLATAKLARYIEEVVAAAPPLRPEQRERLAALLTAGSA